MINIKMETKEFEDLEIWDYPPGYDNYKVSSKGKVWSMKNKKYLRPIRESDGYLKVHIYKDGNRKNFLVHRLVANTFYFYQDYEGYEIDHVDRDKSNNNLLNLRFCTTSENRRNRGMQRNNTSGYKGVSWCKQYKTWKCNIRTNGVNKGLGSFNTKEEAYNAYKEASKELHGNFSYVP